MRFEIFPSSTCPLLNIDCIGYAEAPSVTRFGPGMRNSYIIHYVISGKGFFNGNTVEKGQGFLITPQMNECYFPDTENPWKFIYAVSSDDKMSTLFDMYGAEKDTGIFNFGSMYRLEELREILISGSKKSYDAFEMLELFLGIFKCRSGHTDAEHMTGVEIYAREAEKYIETNLHRPVSVKELTDFLGIGQPYLFKIFKVVYSKGPKRFISDKKLAYSEKLLESTDMSVTQIANSVGFESVFDFSKFFRLNTGVSPLNYRKHLLGSTDFEKNR